jgi:hypothetical protein
MLYFIAIESGHGNASPHAVPAGAKPRAKSREVFRFRIASAAPDRVGRNWRIRMNAMF